MALNNWLTRELPDGLTSAAVAIGVFDGVHIGHRKIISTLSRMAAKRGVPSLVLSFDPHPRTVVSPESAPTLLVSPARRAELLRDAGADFVAFLRFTPELARLEPMVFLDEILGGDFSLAALAVGNRWRFGRGAAGGVEELARFAALHGIDFEGVGEVMRGGEVVSSSRTRQAIAAGRLREAAGYLGRAPELEGVVMPGLGIAAAKLEHPTANFVPEYGVTPPDGVYAAKVRCVGGGCYSAALNVGSSPTVRAANGLGRRVEAHLIDFSGDLYGERIVVELVKFIRREKRFRSLEALRVQIAADVEKIREVLK
ncbi:MAG: riboflavin biosynthesis protein RibF [Victivallaceae bacterium]|nr:riboflavin biosynthesis protein RibF [Victivallaceae bacterium]